MSSILKAYKAKEVREGGGVIVNRVFGYGQTSDFDPFLMLDYFETDHSNPSKGFPWHPHKGIETISYMLRGRIEHQDTLGNKGVIGPGELQWMTAGKGIMHQEMPYPSDNGYQGFQFWVNLPQAQKLIDPTYKDIREGQMQSVQKDGYVVNVIAGTYDNVVGPIDKSNLGITMLHFRAKKGTTMTLNREAGKQGYIFVFKGNGNLNNDSIEKPTAYVLDSGQMNITASTDLEFIFAEGTPLKESISWYGPIVMNTRQEIEETLEDLRTGKFVEGDMR